MEFLCGGELFDYIVKKKRMDEDEACKVFDQIIAGIQYSHKLKIVHRDLKLQNILIDFDKTIRIVDFGLSNTYKNGERLKTACGSPCYAAPEMIDGKEPYEPIMVDIWSAGIILYAMVCGFLPFEDPDTRKLYQKILSGQYSVPSHLSNQLRDFLKRVLTVDPKKRIRPAQMKQHPWWKRHALNFYPQGLIVGYHKIPVDYNILKQVKTLNLDMQACQQPYNFTTTSINADKKKRSKSKLKNKSLSHYNTNNPTHNNTIIHQRMNKSFKEQQKPDRKNVMTRSNSKKKKSPRKADVVFSENQNFRPRAMSQKSKINAKKSHQHSYMIGIDSGHDWPLEPKYKAENPGKIRNALRKR